MSIELINAARLGQLDTINSLIAEGVNLDSLYAENTALMAASYNNQEAIVESLIKHGVNINTPNNYQQTALIFASAAGNKNIVKLLVQHGANLEANDSRGSTALMMAVIKNSDESIAKILLDAGADINARDGAGDTVLMYAIRGNNIAAARYILRYYDNARLERDQELADTHLYVNSANRDGVTALMQAAFAGYRDNVEFLLQNNADVHARDSAGMTPLMQAVSGAVWYLFSFYGDHAGVIRLLLSYGADIHATDNTGQSAIMKAGILAGTIKALFDNHMNDGPAAKRPRKF